MMETPPCRKPMTASELAALGERLEALYRPAAVERRREGWRRRDGEPSALQTGRSNEVREQVGDALGVSGAPVDAGTVATMGRPPWVCG
jgi:hypothetical protein